MASTHLTSFSDHLFSVNILKDNWSQNFKDIERCIEIAGKRTAHSLH